MKMELASIVKTAGIVVTSTSTVFAAFFFIDSRYYHAPDAELAHIEIQVRSNLMYLEARRSIVESEIKRIADVITMYENRQLINGTLDAADVQRLSKLKEDINEMQTDRNAIRDTIEAMRLETVRLNNSE